ncbi:MAG: hypothetical protein M3N59_01165 [bacterium]|nr:hypothetical protein [bacterium]
MPHPTLNPDSTARAEYEFWRAHDDKDRPRIEAALERWTGELFGIDAAASREAVRHLFGAVAAHDIRDWDAAVEYASRYYRVIREHSHFTFEPHRAGELEIAWWRKHDELEHEPDKSGLVDAFCKLYAEVFGISENTARTACELKAQATVHHDRAEDPGTPVEAVEDHWAAAADALSQSYTLLRPHLI